MAKKKENTSAKQPKKETAEANDKRKAVKASKTMKVRVTGAVAWLGYPWNVGQEKELDAQQAQELIDQGVAEKI